MNSVHHDKQAFDSSMDPFEEQIRMATQRDEPHRQICELLKAFRAAGIDASAQVVGVVTSCTSTRMTDKNECVNSGCSAGTTRPLSARIKGT